MRAPSSSYRWLAATVALCAVASVAAPRPKPRPKPSGPKKGGVKAAPKPAVAAKSKPPATDRKKPSPLGARGVPASVRPRPPAPDRIGEPMGKQPVSVLPAARSVAAVLAQPTDLEMDPRADWKAETVALGRPLASPEELARVIQAWKATAVAVHRRISGGLDPGGTFSAGRADVLARDAAGQPLGLPTAPEGNLGPAWTLHLKDLIRSSLDAGAEGIWLEAPAPGARAGGSAAFKTAWKETYGVDWSDPLAAPPAFFRGARLRSDLSLNAVNECLRQTRDYARDKARPIPFMLSVRSPLALASEDRLFPLAAVSRLPLDGLVGRLRTVDAALPITVEGKPVSLPFENAWLMSSYFGGLVEALPDKALVFSPEVAGDNLQLGPDYQRLFPLVLGASLFAWPARGYTLPDPEHLSLPAPGGEASPGDGDFLTVLANLASALKELPVGEPPEWVSGGTRGIGVLTLDTLGFQRGGPQGSTLRSVHGLTLPLLRRGVPVQVVPAERVADPGYLSRYRVLLLSYEMQKPLGPELNQGLADWVKGGGTLVFFAGEDPYNALGEWWNRNGLASPADHLVKLCAPGADTTQRQVRQPASRFREVARAEATAGLETRQSVPIALAGRLTEGQPLFVRFGDATPRAAGGARVGRVRVLEGERVRADFVAGSAGEKPFLVESNGAVGSPDHRAAEGEASFVYRFNRLGRDARLEIDLAGSYSVAVAAGEDPAAQLKPSVPQLPPARIPSTYALATYPLSGPQPLYTLGESGGAETAPVWAAAYGQGTLIYSSVPATFGAESAAGAEFVRGLARYACGKAALEYVEAPFILRRGSYMVAHAMGRTASLPGQYLDLLRPEMPLVENPALPYREVGFFKQVKLGGRVPTLLHASHRARVQEATGSRTRVLLEGPTGAWGVLRLFPAGMSLVGVEAIDAQGQPVVVDVRPEGRTMRFRYRQQATGVTLTLRWIRPEARLTK